MRPDTEPNVHAKRIMAGAFVLVAAAVAVRVGSHFPTLALGVALTGVVTFGCYVIGLVALELSPGNHS